MVKVLCTWIFTNQEAQKVIQQTKEKYMETNLLHSIENLPVHLPTLPYCLQKHDMKYLL